MSAPGAASDVRSSAERPGPPDLRRAPQDRPARKLRLLTFTTLYPSAAMPRHGIFVETRLNHLVGTGAVDARVVAPVPWFPFESKVFGRYADFARTPRFEQRGEVPVHHPPYLAIPRVGMLVHPRTLAFAAAREIEAILRKGWEFDAIDAHYFYPDGVAAAEIARRFGKPFVVTARGSDINLIARIEGPRRMILDAAKSAGKLIAVSSALKQALVDMGIEAGRIVVLRNGVDVDLFRPAPVDESRKRLGLGGGVVVASVGNLVPEKGHDLVIRSVARLREATLLIVGEGPERSALTALARRLGLTDHVRFLKSVPQRELRLIYSAADVLALGSTREGWPNVVLEAMACGTPVVAMDVGGVREMVTDDEVGRVVHRRDDGLFAAAMVQIVVAPPDRSRVRRHAQRFGWQPISQGQLDLFRAVAGARSSAGCA